MSLSAKQRILKLRETEFKLQKLQNDLLNGNENTGSASMTDFLSHHKELMALPGSNRDSLPFRFSFQAPKRYMEMKQTQKLTLPSKIPAKSISRISPYKEPSELDASEKVSSYKVGLAGHRSLALQSLLNELDQETSKLTLAFPKLDKHTLLNKTPFLRKMQSSSSRRNNYKGNKDGLGQPSRKGLIKKQSTSSSGKLLPKPSSLIHAKSKKVKLMWNNELSETASTATASELILGSDNEKFIPYQKSEEKLTSPDSEELRQSVAYALGASNLMGVILPSTSSQITTKRGPSTWDNNKSSKPLGATTTAENDDDSISAKEAVTILRRRKFPERKPPLPKSLAPHERGLVGVEISNFEPQCAFFYRDRNGNYNPHLHHSKQVTESMKWGGWNKKLSK